MSYSSQLEDLIEELGGCGLMQKLLCITIHCSCIITFWSILAMAFIGYDPGFTCHTLDVKLSSLSTLNISYLSTDRLCSVGSTATCSSYIFRNSLNTVVSEWNLVCEKRWIVAFITSIQMVGVVIGSIISGQISDSTGRKPTMIAGVTTTVLFNFAGFFAQSWKAYSVIRFIIGIGFGLAYTVQFTLMIEFVPSQWRPLAVCFPSEPLISMLYALLSWWLHDWKRIHLFKSFIGLFFLIILWFAVATTWYCMALGMESISVDIYMTIFLINVVDVPAYSATGPLVNKFGRRKICFVVFGLTDRISHNSASLTMEALVTSLLAKMTCSTAFTAVIVYTTELYPTEIRTTGYGFQAAVGRLGAIASPLLIHLDGLYPGSMYFICGVLMILSTGGILRLKETKDMVLQDSVKDIVPPGDR
ncbi:organic cation transporter protein-like [Mercenaria mercenaria]|uniref:organic cation transporter protein-like n=1 Tax=Mercenaria mercenaria TaxID=6596 RepID=UPI00234F8704|nr:organic cation transporter protein-like [Mercenaria mercenaria]